ncbi:hypothetical protein PEPS_08150 [Persicobacter psychrovividus]|uniref:Uncharacterized protein n=1 Tax=Persicobacter psychrovividus TaxID=387638 RepID=A0ABM7VC67_9BACT|nr:hypothetical protein PEPS_08150 [Persicobacter psychrovividus]
MFQRVVKPKNRSIIFFNIFYDCNMVFISLGNIGLIVYLYLLKIIPLNFF